MGGFGDLAIFERAHRDGRLITRIYAVTPIGQWERLRDTVAARGKGDEWLRIGGLKGFADGSLGSHTAAMFAPFADSRFSDFTRIHFWSYRKLDPAGWPFADKTGRRRPCPLA